MGDLTITTFLTLDGIMQAPGGPGEDPSGGFQHEGWMVPHVDDEFGTYMTDIFTRAGAFLIGRGTYDIFAAYWPNAPVSDDPVQNKLNELPKHVASRSTTKFDWHNSHHVKDVLNEVVALKAQTNGELQVHGSPGLAQTLIKHDLIDQYNLLFYPVVLGGQGKRLFGTGAVPTNLELVQCHYGSKGALYATYLRTGLFEKGTFGG